MVAWISGTLTALFGISLLLSCGLLAASVGHRVAEQVPMLILLFDLIAAGLLAWLWLAGGLVLARAMAVPMPFGVLAVIALHVAPQAFRLWLLPVTPGA